MRTTTRTVAFAALATGLATPALAQDVPAEHPLLAGFAHVTTGDGEGPPLANPLDMMVPYWGIDPTLEGGPGIELTMRPEGDVVVVEMVKTGLLDDAVRAERYRGVSSPMPGGWFHGELGVQVKCARGDNPNEWTMGPCP